MAVFGVVQISDKISVSAAEIKLDLKLSSQIETTENYNPAILSVFLEAAASAIVGPDQD